MDIAVWLDDWQMQCCGDTFAVGDKVSWTLRDSDKEWLDLVLGKGLADGIDSAEEHHGGVGQDVAPTVGVIASIRAVHCRYAPRPDGPKSHLFEVPGSGVVTAVESADGWTPDRGDLKLAGYVVLLTGARPA